MNSLEGLEAMAAEATTKVDELLGDGWTCCITVNDGFKYFMFGGYLQNKFGRVVVRKKAISRSENCTVDLMVINFFGMINNVVDPCDKITSKIRSKLGINQPKS